jgi:flagellar biosynthesis protein FliR
MIDDATLLAALPVWGFAFVLVMARVGAAIMLLPAFGEADPPPLLRVGFALGITILLLPGIAPSIPQVPEAGTQALLMVAAEVGTGAWLGWLARMLVLALPIAGQFLSYMLGIANVLQPDATLGAQATPVARLLDIAAPLLVLVTGLYAMPLAALAGSYRVIPAGAPLPLDAADVAVRMVTQSFALAVRLASPFLLATIIWHVATGLLARLVPRIQVYFVAMPAQILGGILLLAVVAGTLIDAWQDALRTGLASLPGL